MVVATAQTNVPSHNVPHRRSTRGQMSRKRTAANSVVSKPIEIEVQSLDRAIAILQALGTADEAGLRLLDLQSMTGLARPTVHRALTTFMRHGFVVQDHESRRYRLGHEVAVLGYSVHSRSYDLREISQPEMHELAQETGDTAFLTVRSGNDAVCIDRRMGPYPIRAFTVDIGTRRPLGVGAGGVSLLACMPQDEARDVYASIRTRLSAYQNVTEEAIRSAVAACAERGYALSDGLVMDGIRGLAVAIRDPRDAAVGALSIAAIRQRIDSARIPVLVRTLDRCRRGIERRIARSLDGSARR